MSRDHGAKPVWRLRWLVMRTRSARGEWTKNAMKSAWKKGTRLGGRAVMVAAGVVVIWLAYRVIEPSVETPKRVLTGVGIGLVGLLLLTIRPDDVKDAITRMTKLSFGGVGLELEARSAAQGASAEDPLDKSVRTDDLLDLRLLLEAKLAYLCKLVLPGKQEAGEHRHEFATFGSLEYDGYITRDQARTAARLLVYGVVGPSTLQSESRSKFFAEAKAFVESFRAIVFSAHVRLGLTKAAQNELRWTALRVFPEHDRRRDLVIKRGDQEHLVVPVFATNPGSKLAQTVINRLAQKETPLASSGKRYIVVPDNSALASSPDADPAVVKLHELLSAFDTPGTAPTAADQSRATAGPA